MRVVFVFVLWKEGEEKMKAKTKSLGGFFFGSCWLEFSGGVVEAERSFLLGACVAWKAQTTRRQGTKEREARG